MAIREPTTGKGRYDLISPFGNRRLALRLEGGSEKYDNRNWEKGMPFSRCIESAKRHIDQFVMGMEDEDHLAAACFNLYAIMHFQELGMIHLDDMPHYLRKDKAGDSG